MAPLITRTQIEMAWSLFNINKEKGVGNHWKSWDWERQEPNRMQWVFKKKWTKISD